ncbi:3-keto-disaccharide hydrolase [Rubrolithibacter danxiaensis]|uniref:3-keto-disaccharide hydrolase n=1 Tax=Rubrolithibacter danxiaensis TaxID=3390805 RepID=UPI003BF8F972
MNSFKLLLAASLFCAVLFPSIAFSQNSVKEDWIQLFNGKDLKDWDIKITGYNLNENYGNTFRVENGILKVSYDQYNKFTNQFGHIYYKKPFSYYKLRFEYRFVGEQLQGGPSWDVRNSGVMVHSQAASTLAKDQEFPVSLEIQVLGGLGDGPRATANLCTPGTYVEMNGDVTMQHCINSSSKTYEGDQWVTVEALVLGDSLIQHLIDGKVVLSYKNPKIGETGDDMERYLKGAWAKKIGTPLKEGYIALQAESHPVEFRKVELLNLKGCMNPKCPRYRPYFVAAGACDCKK